MERHVLMNLLWVGFALGLVALNGFFVAAEFALIKIRPARLTQMVRQGQGGAKTTQWLAKRLDRSLSACQLGITMASLGLGWVGEPAVARLMEPLFRIAGVTTPAVVHGVSFAISFTLITAAHLVLGEQAPKIFAIRRPEQMAMWVAMPLKAFYLASYPLLRSLDKMTSMLLRTVGMTATSEHESPHSPEELRTLASHARTHGELSSWEHRLVEAAFDFEETVCRQIMVPRTEVVFIDINTPLEEIRKVMRKSLHTRYPVGDGSLDKIHGIMHVKDLVGLPEGRDLRSILRPPRYVPETAHISKLLGHFQKTRQHLALVVDEHGMMVGIVTMENVLEKIVGPVRDEFDVEMPDIVPEGTGQLMIKGKTPIAELSAALDQSIDAEGFDTVGGLMADRLGKIPAVGERIELDGYDLVVMQVRHNHATRIRAVVKRDPDVDAEPAEPA